MTFIAGKAWCESRGFWGLELLFSLGESGLVDFTRKDDQTLKVVDALGVKGQRPPKNRWI